MNKKFTALHDEIMYSDTKWSDKDYAMLLFTIVVVLVTAYKLTH